MDEKKAFRSLVCALFLHFVNLERLLNHIYEGLVIRMVTQEKYLSKMDEYAVNLISLPIEMISSTPSSDYRALFQLHHQAELLRSAIRDFKVLKGDLDSKLIPIRLNIDSLQTHARQHSFKEALELLNRISKLAKSMPDSVPKKKESSSDITAYIQTLERRIRALEAERQIIELQRNKCEKERDSLLIQVKKLRK